MNGGRNKAREVTKTSSKLKTKFVRWLDLLNKPGKLFLCNDELVEGLSGFWCSWMDVVRLVLLVMGSPCTIETPALRQSLAFIHESCQIRKIFNQLKKTEFHYLIA